VLLRLECGIIQTRRRIVDDLLSKEGRDAVFFLERIYLLFPLIAHHRKFVSQLCQAFGLRHECVDNLAVGLETKGLNRSRKDMIEEIPRICPLVWSPKEQDADCCFEDTVKMRLC
jgi:hypothetical protein